jgi:hypothetical protein
MNEYKSVQNMSMLLHASQKMLKDKFDVILSDDKLGSLIESICRDVETEYANARLQLNEINKLVLSKLKAYMANQPIAEESSESSDDIINAKVRELEDKRRAQTCLASVPLVANPVTGTNVIGEQLGGPLGGTVVVSAAPVAPAAQAAAPASPTIITYTPPPQQQAVYKTFILNGVHRDWHKYPDRNNFKLQIPVAQSKYTFYPEYLCFPEFVKGLTPYVLINLSDGAKNIVYTFTRLRKSGKWDIWHTVDNPEPIALNGRQWTIQCFDYLNNELELGADDVNVIEAALFDDNSFMIKYDKSDKYDKALGMTAGDYILIRTGKGQQHAKKIIDISHKDGFMVIDKNDIDLCDFMNSKIMNTNSQFSLIVKYCGK